LVETARCSGSSCQCGGAHGPCVPPHLERRLKSHVVGPTRTQATPPLLPPPKMSYTAPHSKQPSAKPPPVGGDSVNFRRDNLGLPSALPGGSTFETTGYGRYDQVRTILHRGVIELSRPWNFHPSCVQIGARPGLDQMGQQPNSPPYGTGVPFTVQDGTKPEDQRSRNVDGKVRPVCVYCNKSFGRDQELQRHMKDIHTPRRQCPFCEVTWTRPDKIKAHIVADHADKFTAEMLEGIKAFCGRRIVEFMDAYDYGLDTGPAFGSSSQF